MYKRKVYKTLRDIGLLTTMAIDEILIVLTRAVANQECSGIYLYVLLIQEHSDNTMGTI